MVMSKQIIFGLTAEGSTDIRFLKNVISRLLTELSWECSSVFDVYDIQVINSEGDTFVEKMIDAATKAFDYTQALCIHVDADNRTFDNAIKNKFEPFFTELESIQQPNICRCIIPTIPIQMIESWMLADKNLFKLLIDARNISDETLKIEKAPESYSDPKSVIEAAIRYSLSSKSKRRRDTISISDLYEPLGNSIGIDSLRRIPSFAAFESNVRNALKQLGLLQ